MTKYPECPHCGFVHNTDAAELGFTPGREGVQVLCWSCGRDFYAVQRIRVSYQTYGRDDISGRQLTRGVEDGSIT